MFFLKNVRLRHRSLIRDLFTVPREYRKPNCRAPKSRKCYERSSCFGLPKSAMENSVGIGLKDCTLTDSAFKLKENELSHCTWSSLCLMTHCGHQNRNESSHCTRWPLCQMTHCGHHKLSSSHWTPTQCSKQDPVRASADSHLNCNSNNRENCYDFFISNQTVSTYKVTDIVNHSKSNCVVTFLGYFSKFMQHCVHVTFNNFFSFSSK